MAAPGIVAAYSSDNGDPVSVPNVQTGDWVLGISGSIYTLDDTDVSFTGSGAGTWAYVGAKLGNANAPDYQNFGLVVAYKEATSSGTYTVGVTGPTNERVHGVLHLRGCEELDGPVTDSVYGQDRGSVPTVDLGSKTTTVADTLLIAAYGNVNFSSGSRTWTPPSGMSEQLDIVHGSGFNTLGVAAGIMANPGSSGNLSAVCSMSGNPSGSAGKLFAIIGADAPGPSGPATNRFFLAG